MLAQALLFAHIFLYTEGVAPAESLVGKVTPKSRCTTLPPPNHVCTFWGRQIHTAAVRPQPKRREVLPTNSRKQRMGK